MSKKKTGGLKSINGGKSSPGSGSESNGGRANGRFSDNSDRQTDTPPPQNASPPQKVIDFESARAQRSQDNRRTVERFFLQHMIDAYCELDGGKTQLALEIVELSETGCSFRLPTEKTKLLPMDSRTGGIAPIQVRLYFSKDSYLRVGFDVVNSARDIAAGGQSVRFGCRLDGAYASAEAYAQFARFMGMFVKTCSRDTKHAQAY